MLPKNFKKQTHLFEEFAAISTQEWIEKINADLSKTNTKLEDLTWHYNKDLKFKPFYRKEDLKEHLLYNPKNSFAEPYLRSYKNKPRACDIAAQVHVGENDLAYKKINFLNAQDIDTLVIVSCISPDVHKGIIIFDENALRDLLEKVDLERVRLFFDCGDLSPYFLKLFLKEVGRRRCDPSKVQVKFNYDPLSSQLEGTTFFSESSLNSVGNVSSEILSELILEAHNQSISIKPICISDTLVHNAGASTTQCLAYSLCAFHEYFHSFYQCMQKKKDFSSYDLKDFIAIFSKHVFFHTAISSNYFIEIARIRAFRFLLSCLFRLYEKSHEKQESNKNIPPQIKIHISAENSLLNKSDYDLHTNVLRCANECMAALLADIDEFKCYSYDYVEPFSMTSDEGDKLAIHTQHILQKESFLNKVVDPMGGSYYIEVLTDSLAKAAWTKFQEIQKLDNSNKGLQLSIKQSYLQKEIKENYAQSQANFAQNDGFSLLGVNRFPNPEQKSPTLNSQSFSKRSLNLRKPKPAENSSYKPCSRISEPTLLSSIDKLWETKNSNSDIETFLSFYYNKKNEETSKNKKVQQENRHSFLKYERIAKPIEELRRATEIHVQKNFNLPSIFLMRWGNLAISKQRANFISNFIACIGYKIKEGKIHSTMQEAIKEAAQSKADILALCAPSENYKNLLTSISDVFKVKTDFPYLIAVSVPKEQESKELKGKGIDLFIHKKTNLIESLTDIQKTLKVIV